MRKGRSQRRTRKSVPSKPAGSGTQLFVGVSSAPPPPSASSLDPIEALEKLEVVETKATIEPATDSEPPLAIEAKHVGTSVTRVELEPTHIGTTVTRVAIEVTPEPKAEARAEIADVPQDSLAPVVVAEPSATPSEPPPADAEAKHEEPTPYVPEVAEKLAEAEAAPSVEKDGEPEVSKAEAAPETTQKSAAIDAYEEEEDDRTPPAIEFGAGAADEFFEAGRRASLAPETTETFEDLEKVKQKNLPHVVARRAKFARYVGWAVGIAGVLCLAAVARTAFSPSAAVASASTKNAVVVQPVAAAEPPKVEEPTPVEQPKAEEAKPEEAKAEAPKAEEAKSEEPKAEAPKPAAASPEPGAATPTVTAATTGDKTAREEKKASQQALERGRTGESIAAGERSVALDPGDAEAWLILGAAYQQKGDLANMRRAFKSCLEQATRGPKGECAQFAH